MSTYTIGQIAARSGFATSTLRYYENLGLLRPADRTDAGYRIYDDDTLARLAFIARAKQLGCTLEEITDLVQLWDGDECGPVQRRLHELASAKITDAQRQIAELTAFTAQLQRAAARLTTEPVDGPCRDDCACVTETEAAAPRPEIAVQLGVKRDAPAIVCTLTADAIPDRLAQWRALLNRVRSRSVLEDGGQRVEFHDDVPLDELTRLVAAEQQCCAFFSFAITVDARGLGLDVRAPDEAKELVTALFGGRTPQHAVHRRCRTRHHRGCDRRVRHGPPSQGTRGVWRRGCGPCRTHDAATVNTRPRKAAAVLVVVTTTSSGREIERVRCRARRA